MAKNELRHFVLIDDDPISNKINSWVIRKKFPDAAITAFTDPVAGVDHLQALSVRDGKRATVLFLDINMPETTGWDVLNRIAEFDGGSSEWLNILLLSSSVDENDRQKAHKHPLVSGFIEKPMAQNFYSLFPEIF